MGVSINEGGAPGWDTRPAVKPAPAATVPATISADPAPVPEPTLPPAPELIDHPVCIDSALSRISDRFSLLGERARRTFFLHRVELAIDPERFLTEIAQIAAESKTRSGRTADRRIEMELPDLRRGEIVRHGSAFEVLRSIRNYSGRYDTIRSPDADWDSGRDDQIEFRYHRYRENGAWEPRLTVGKNIQDDWTWALATSDLLLALVDLALVKNLNRIERASKSNCLKAIGKIVKRELRAYSELDVALTHLEGGRELY